MSCRQFFGRSFWLSNSVKVVDGLVDKGVFYGFKVFYVLTGMEHFHADDVATCGMVHEHAGFFCISFPDGFIIEE